jgi:FkbM family methyltransferase
MADPFKLTQRYENIYRRITDWSLGIRPYWIKLNSGLQIGIDSLVTLNLFEEIFIREIYSSAFSILDQIDFIIDLGANRGLFMIYAYHKLTTIGRNNSPMMVCVEPVKENLNRLTNHININQLSGYVIPVEGVVTKQRVGQADFNYYSRHHVTGKIRSGHPGQNIRVNIIDLAKFVKERWIDVLKVDIEGSEEDFLTEYADILLRTKVLIVEFHLDLVNHQACQSIITNSGLVYHSGSGDCEGKTIVETYYRLG